MIQSRLPQRDMIVTGGWGFAPDRYDTPKKEIKPDSLDSQISVFYRHELYSDKADWIKNLYEGMIVYVIDENKMHCLYNKTDWQNIISWKEIVFDQEKQDEFIRLKKLDNLLS